MRYSDGIRVKKERTIVRGDDTGLPGEPVVVSRNELAELGITRQSLGYTE